MRNSDSLPLVSVVIPLYNQSTFVEASIDSVINQTYPNIEIIVVNDGSTDHPDKVLEPFGNKIKVIHQENRGLSGARNRGIQEAEGAYIQFLDSDDLLFKDKIEYHLAHCGNQMKELSYQKVDMLNSDGSVIPPFTYRSNNFFYSCYLLWHSYVTPIHSLLFPREIFSKYGLFDEDLKANEDRFYLGKLAFNGIKFPFLSHSGGLYRKHSESMTLNYIFIVESLIQFYLKMNRYVGESFLQEQFGYSGPQMLAANCSHYYLNLVRKGVPVKVLKKIKTLMSQKSIPFFVAPLPSRFKHQKRVKMKMAAYWDRMGKMNK